MAATKHLVLDAGAFIAGVRLETLAGTNAQVRFGLRGGACGAR
jgi:hypothetical protein